MTSMLISIYIKKSNHSFHFHFGNNEKKSPNIFKFNIFIVDKSKSEKKEYIAYL